VDEHGGIRFFTDDTETIALARRYFHRLQISGVPCWLTTERRIFEGWIGRRIGSAYGGAYLFDRRAGLHLILINLNRIDRERPRAVEIVVAEEALHLRDRLDGDLRGHAKHGYDRIAHRVASLVGVPITAVRACLLPVTRRPYRYLFRCSRCTWAVPRKKRGRWICPTCWYEDRKRIMLREETLPMGAASSSNGG
jgi:hypothetical protein